MPGPVVSLTGGWGCNVALPGCISAGEITLAPGDSISFSLGITLAGDFGEDTFRNCALIGWLPMGFAPGFDINSANDQDCATHRVMRPDVWDEAVDLAVRKTVRGVDCRPGGDCEFTIEVRNVGTVNYTGPIIVDDIASTLHAGAAVLPGSTVTAITPGWTCAVEGPGARCQHAGDLTLTAAGPPIRFEVSVNLPADTTRNTLRNCGNIAWDAMPMAGDANADNDRNCASRPIVHEEDEVAVRPEFDLVVSKEAAEPSCSLADICTFNVRITNAGPDAFTSELSVTDELPPYETWRVAAPWDCEIAGTTLTCTHPEVSLRPGGYVDMEVTGRLRASGLPGVIRNCTAINWEGTRFRGDTNAANDNDCAEARLVSLTSNLSLSTQALGTCRLGVPCNIGVRINNTSTETFVGQLGIDGRTAPPLRLRQVRALGPGWSCQTVAEGRYECRHNPITLAPGAQQSFRISAAVPSSLNANAIIHSVRLVWVEGRPDADAKDDLASVTIPLQQVDQPVVTPTRPACTGGRYWNGQACVCRRGYEWDGRTCVRGAPPVGCEGGRIVAGQCRCPAGWRQVLVRPRVFRCVKPVVRIQCTNGTVRNGRCICPKGYNRRTIGPNRFRCVKPVVRIQCTNGTVRNGRCICPKGYNRRTIGPNRFRCVKPVVRIQCTNGTVRNGRCICPKGYNRRTIGPNRFRCVKPVVRIQCTNGTVRNGRCICRQGWRRVRRGRNRYACLRPQARLRCSGGSVRNGRCVCPAGKVARRVGRNAFRCVWRAPD